MNRPAVTAVIRFRDSAQTLPAVLASLASQTTPPECILGVDTGSQDGSADLIQSCRRHRHQMGWRLSSCTRHECSHGKRGHSASTCH